MTGSRGFELQTARGLAAERVALALAWLLALGAPQLLAGVFPWGMLSLATMALLALGAACWLGQRRLPSPSLLDAAMLVALVFTVVQAVPLPCTWVKALASDGALELARVHGLLGLPAPERCTLSRDPGGTHEEIVKGIAIVAAWGASRVLVQRGLRRELATAVAASGVLLSAVTLAHVATGATEVFGVYAPTDVPQRDVIGPVLNLNALGGVLALCVPMLVALALSAESAPGRLALLAATVLTVGTLLLTRSRGATGALALGLLLLGALGLWARRRRRPAVPTNDLRARLSRWATPAAVVLLLAFAALGSFTELRHEFRAGGLDKVELIARSAAFVREHPWLGVGRGAFASAFARAHQGPTRFDHPENLVVQWASEWGVPVTALLLLALLHALARAVRRGESWERSGALAGVLALGAQNMLDLGLELLGVAVLGAMALACAVGERAAIRTSPTRARAGVAAAVALPACVVALLAAPIQRDHLPYADRELRALLAVDDWTTFRARLRPALLAHPGAPVLSVLGASEALRRDQADALPWINRSQEVAPGWALPHLLAAQWLWNHQHRGQALLELSIAARVDLHASRGLTCAIAVHDPDGVVAIAGRTSDPERFLELAAECVGRSALAGHRLDAALAKLRPGATGPLLRALSRALAGGDAEAALKGVRAASSAERSSSKGVELEVRALLALQRPAEALQVIQQAGPGVEAGQLVGLEIEVLSALGDLTGLQTAFERLRGLAAGPAELTAAYRREAATWLALKRPASALAAYDQALGISNDTGVLRNVARLAHEIGDERRAHRAWAELCRLDPGDETSCRAAHGGRSRR